MASTTTPRDFASTPTTPLTPSDLLSRITTCSNSSNELFTTTPSKPSTIYDPDSPNDWSATNTTENTADNTAENSETDTRATTPENLEGRSRYDRWHCPFDSNIPCEAADIESQPTTELAFLNHVETQLTRIEHLKSGFQAYQTAINTDHHQDRQSFSQDFQTNQNFAIATTTEHLCAVKRDLDGVRAAVLVWKNMDDSQLPVQWRYREILAAAKVYLDKLLRVLAQCHCFHKVNYALVP